MPTAPKLIAAALLGVLGYMVASLVVAYLPPQTRIGLMREITAFFGIVVGWRFIGRRSGAGLQFGLGIGLTGAVAMTLIALLFFAGYQMIRKSMRFAYDGPFDAILGMFDIALHDAQYLAQVDVLGALVVGGLLIGLIAELAARRWS